ncbi:hypothetical protein [Thermodesulforhabdus norvegica]|nr:hypothetical protein [Thermodesulforhabdus norvegica]
MGIGVHLFTDALWHPSINRAADIISQEFRWPRSASHTLLESFLQRCFLPERTEKGIIREMMGSTRLLPGIGPVLTQVTKELLEVLSVSSRGITQWKIYLTMNLHILFLLVLHHKAVSKTLWNRISSGNPPGDLTSILAPGRIYVTRFKEKIDHFREVADLFSRQFYSDRIRQLTTLFDGLLKVLQ